MSEKRLKRSAISNTEKYSVIRISRLLYFMSR